MKKNIFIFICLCGMFSCNSHSADNSSAAKQLSDMVEGKDYLTLKRFRVIDNQGFNQPVEVSSFLLPANWQVNSNIKWDVTKKCIPEMLEANLIATSPDKDFEILMFPATQFDWSDDPIYLDAMQKGFNMHSCTIAQPLDATGFIAQSIAQQMNAQVKSARIIPEIQKLMDEGANNMTQMARQAGNNAYSHQGSAAEGILQFADGKEGIALCTVMQTITTTPNAQGYGMANTFQSYVSMRIVMKYKSGNEAMARKIFGTFLSSSRVNPQWSSAVQAIFANIGRNAQIQLGQQIEIARQAQEEISNNIIRNWESSNANKNTNEVSPDQFGQYIRGVDSWSDENGNKIELSSGYSNAWSKGDGTYILSDNPAFDPNVTFNEGWNRLSK
jgi:hypothetical protein